MKYQKPVKKFHMIMITRVAILSIFVCIPFISHVVEEYPLKDMDLTFTIREDFNEEEAEFLSIGGYVESRDQVRIKEVDEPISLRQRLWLERYLGHDWIRGFASAYFDYDPAVRDWTEDKDEIYYVELNEAYLTIDTERMDLIFGKKMMRWGTRRRDQSHGSDQPPGLSGSHCQRQSRCQTSDLVGE